MRPLIGFCLTFLYALACSGSPLPAMIHSDARLADMCDAAAQDAARATGTPVQLLRAITRAETGRSRNGELRPWPWVVNMDGEGHWFASRMEAQAFVFDRFLQGARNFDIGCFQVNYRWHGGHFRSIEDMFDPHENARFAAEFLSDLYVEFGDWPVATGAFHSRTKWRSEEYAKKVMTIRARLNGTGTRPVRPDRPATAAEPAIVTDAAPLVAGPSSGLGSLVPASSAAASFISLD